MIRAEHQNARRSTLAQVFVTACSGSGRLSDAVGLPLVHVGVALDAARAISRLNETNYASGVRVPALFQPITFDTGWSDWAMFEYAPNPWSQSMGATPDGVRAGEGRLTVTLPPDVTIGEFREELQAGLRHLRLHEVASEMAYMESRSDAGLEYVVQPRYTPNDVDRDFRRARRVDDLYVFDPADVPWRLFWIVVAARAAVIDSSQSP